MTSLLATKLYFPPARSNLIKRPRLLKQLEEGLRGPLTLISAPAGYGKTTLMSEWYVNQGRNMPVAWFSLDASDNDPVRFWVYLASALNTLQRGLVNDALLMLESPQLPPIESLLTVMINALNTFPKDFVLALDDVHTITKPEIFRGIDFILDHMPLHMHLVLLTRSDPSLSLSRLRGRGQLNEIRARDLSFNSSEAAAFLKDVMKLNLLDEEIETLESRTEGWIAGLQLAALTIQGREDSANIIATFGGGYHYIVDFLVEEVLNRQPEEIRKFLIQTSILERLSGPLCDALTGQTNGDVTLQQLERDNLFVFPIGGECCWYRYHHLFADFLQARLKQEQKDSLEKLCLQASNWCAQQDLVEEAIRYALKAHNYTRAADLIEKNSWDLLNRGNVATVLNWIAALPEGQLSVRRNLEVIQIWAMFISGMEDQVVRRMQKINVNAEQQASGEETLLLAIQARWHGNTEESIKLTEKAVKQLPENQSLMHGQAWFNRGMLYKDTNLSKAQQAFSRAGALSESRNDIQGALKSLYFEGTMFRLQGALHHADSIFRHALDLTKETPFYNGVGYIHLGMAELTYEWNDLAETIKHLNEALKLALERNLNELHFNVVLAMARVHRARGEWSEAQKELDQAEKLAHQAIHSAQMRIHSFLIIPVLHEQVGLWIAQGKKVLVPKNLESSATLENIPLIYQQAKQTTLARILISQQNYRKAITILNQSIDQAKNARMSAYSPQLLRSSTYLADDAIDSALLDLENILVQTEAEGYSRLFFDEGKPVFELLTLANTTLENEKNKAYINKLLPAFSDSMAKANLEKPSIPQSIVDSLSDRELQVLTLVASGKSNQEIADELVIALGTVKRHVYNIYGKLGVKNRTECVAQARELHLLQ